MRNRFDEQLVLLNKMLIEMGSLCENIISMSVKALTCGDIKLAEGVSEYGEEIDKMEKDIESACLKLLLQQQPVAKDLRQISAALKMITDMERIGDQAEDIADIVVLLNGRTGDEHLQINDMAEATMKMVTDSVDAFVKQDVEIARAVLLYDDIVDDHFDKMKSNLISMIADNTADGEYAIDLLMIAKYLERIGDHATNIAEWVLFSITGLHKGEEL